MALLKRILVFLKDLFCGALYPGLFLGLMLMAAAALILLRPFQALTQGPLPPLDPQGPETALAQRLLRLGTELALGCGAAILLVLKAEAWWKHKSKKGAA
jgi:hypothetical protein